MSLTQKLLKLLFTEIADTFDKLYYNGGVSIPSADEIKDHSSNQLSKTKVIKFDYAVRQLQDIGLADQNY